METEIIIAMVFIYILMRQSVGKIKVLLREISSKRTIILSLEKFFFIYNFFSQRSFTII